MRIPQLWRQPHAVFPLLALTSNVLLASMVLTLSGTGTAIAQSSPSNSASTTPTSSTGDSEEAPPLPENLRNRPPNWIQNSGTPREVEDSISMEVGQEVLVDRLNDSPDVVRRNESPSVVILEERSSGQQFILNPGQNIALVLPQRLIFESRGEGMLYPLPSYAPISSNFGFRVHPISGLASFHQGIDLAAPPGTPILAAFSGQVIAAGPAGGLGNAVVLAHDESRRTRYGHMLSVAVQANTWVERGQVIGYVGSTGRSTGPHLHFEFWSRRNGEWIAEDVSAQLRQALAVLNGAPANPAAAATSATAAGGN